MTKRLLLATCLLLTFCNVSCANTTNPSVAENNDSTRLVNAKWKIDTIADGVVYKRVQLANNEIFNSNQYICVLEILPQSNTRLAFAHRPDRTPTSEMAKDSNAIAAVNGSFFDMDLHNSICYLRIGGKQVGENTPQKSDTVNRKYYQYATIVLENGRPTLCVPDSNRHWEEHYFDSTVKDVMTAGPMLIIDGKAVPQRDDRTFVTYRHNRTALGLKPDGTVILFTVDGRMKLSKGMSLTELEQTLLWLGCTNAINLDGGGSTTLYLRGYPENGIVNYPTDNGRFDHKGERKVSNVIMIMEKNDEDTTVYGASKTIHAQFPGGEDSLYSFIAKNFRYPSTCANVSGRVFAQILVEKDGSISNVKILRSLGKDFDDEVLRVIGLMPRWIPAEHNGTVVRTKYVLPVMFKVEK